MASFLWSIVWFCLQVLPVVYGSVDEVLSFVAPQLFPEGFDWDAAHNRFILGSLRPGCLVTVTDHSSSAEEFLCDEDYAGKASIAGVKIDGKRNRVVLVVQTINPELPPVRAVAAYDLDTKERSLFTPLHTEGMVVGERSVANDVAVDDAGNLYITDVAANFIWKVDYEHGIASVFVRSPLFTSQPHIVDAPLAIYGLNGIAYHPHGFLVVGQTNSGVLFRVELPGAAVSLLRPAPLLRASDGLRFRDNNHLVVVSSHTAWLLSSKTDWATVDVLESVALNQAFFTTAVAIRDGRTFLLRSFLSDLHSGLTREQFGMDEVRFPADTDNNPTSLIITLVVVVLALTAWRWHMNNFYKNYQKKRVTKFD